MQDTFASLLSDFDRGKMSRRQLLQALGVAVVGAPVAAALGQGQCMKTFGSPACDTTAIKPLFEPTGWKTTVLDGITWSVPDYQKEAAFYAALMGWKLRSDDGTKAVMDIGDWGTAIFKAAPPPPPVDTATAAGGGRGGRGGRGGGQRAVVQSFAFGITPWDAKKVEAELTKRGLTPVADNDGKGFESFHVKDPGGWDLQITNGTMKNRRTSPANAKLVAPAPFDSTGWKTIWLDHFSFQVPNYKASASFYTNLLGWSSSYDEGSQNELLMADVGDCLVRGGNPLAPASPTGRGRNAGGASIDHISFGIDPWDTDIVAAELTKRNLNPSIDTSAQHQQPDGTWVKDEIHTAPFRSYHVNTPNGFNLQISWMNKERRLNLANAVKPKPLIKPPGGGGGAR